MSINSTLEERHNTHGDFHDNARLAQAMLSTARSSQNWQKLSDAQKEGLHMIFHKISRALSGDNNNPDHWHDIAGYATLIEKDIKK